MPLNYDDFYVGQEAVFIRSIIQDMMSSFREISGDTNPLHNDSQFAKSRGYDSCLVYGMLTASLYSCLAGCICPAATVFADIYSGVIEQSAAKNPMKRNTKPEDAANLAEYILSDRNTFITGANIPVTGGEEF